MFSHSYYYHPFSRFSVRPTPSQWTHSFIISLFLWVSSSLLASSTLSCISLCTYVWSLLTKSAALCSYSLPQSPISTLNWSWSKSRSIILVCSSVSLPSTWWPLYSLSFFLIVLCLLLFFLYFHQWSNIIILSLFVFMFVAIFIIEVFINILITFWTFFSLFYNVIIITHIILVVVILVTLIFNIIFNHIISSINLSG